MSYYENERERERRASYLHEAGHTVMALHNGQIIDEVFCDGQTAYLNRREAPAQLASKLALQPMFKDPNISLDVLFKSFMDVYRGPFAVMLGGLAGESLELGRALTGLVRGSDDLTSIFIQCVPLLGRYEMEKRVEHANRIVQIAAATAQTVVARRKAHVYTLADALQRKSRLSRNEIDALIS